MSLEIFKQCSLNLAPEMYITKDTKWHPLCRCHDNTRLQSLSVKNQISPYATLSHGTEGPSRNLYNAYIILTLLRRFLRVNDPLLR